MISVTMLTKNSEGRLEEALQALASFDEVVVYDTGSSDRTLEIACTFPNVALHRGAFVGFGPTHNEASRLARHDWILSIDSDEVITPELVQEIFATSLDEKCVYSFPRNNFYRGKWIKGCGWHPDRQIRLYHRQQTSFSQEQVHEKVIVGLLRHVKFEGAVKHYSYETTADFLAKMQSYSHLFAQQNQGKCNSSFCKALGHGFYAFFKSYFIKRGFCLGREGFEVSFYNGNTAFYKYVKLDELNNNS